MRRLSCTALLALALLGLGCGPEVKMQEPTIAPYDGEPAIAFVDTSTTVASTTTAPPATAAPTTTAPTSTALTSTAPITTSTEKRDGFVLDLGDIGDLGDIASPTTAATSTTEDFTLDIRQITGGAQSSTTTSTLPADASAFCRAAAGAHAMVSGDNVGTVSMADYAEALADAAVIAPPEVAAFYSDLASFTQRVADQSADTSSADTSSADTKLADDADSLFARQPVASAFVEAECGFPIA